VQPRESVGCPGVRSRESLALTDHDSVEGLEGRVRGAYGFEDVAATVGGTHQDGEAILIVFCCRAGVG